MRADESFAGPVLAVETVMHLSPLPGRAEGSVVTSTSRYDERGLLVERSTGGPPLRFHRTNVDATTELVIAEIDGLQMSEVRRTTLPGGGVLEESILSPSQNLVFTLEGVQFQIPHTDRQRCHYDDAGRLRRADFEARERLSCTIETDLDELGRYVRIAQLVDEQEVVTVRTTYDDARRTMEWTMSLHGIPAVRERREWNAHGDVIAIEPLDEPTRRRTRLVYDYNERGDWIECRVYLDNCDAPVTRTTRVITYR